ncbi:MAG TPA: nucleotidyltransferase family protein [Actinomycetes bacterium]|nr:nucleotidyltransferase family protein [Actinomycetes bacterium]
MTGMMDDTAASRNLALLREGRRLVEAGARAGLTVRLLGGVGILAHCPSVLERGGVRAIADVDVVVGDGQGRAFSRLLSDAGYQPQARFNALHGDRRMVFHGPLGQLDVLVGTFEMCHTIRLGSRLTLDQPTVTVSDLLLTKLQIVELNEKDAHDALALLGEHELRRAEGDAVNLDYLDELAAADWGLWRTVTGTLASLRVLTDDGAVHARIDAIVASLRRVPKTARFKLRARVGERVPWYLLPDEVH